MGRVEVLRHERILNHGSDVRMACIWYSAGKSCQRVHGGFFFLRVTLNR